MFMLKIESVNDADCYYMPVNELNEIIDGIKRKTGKEVIQIESIKIVEMKYEYTNSFTTIEVVIIDNEKEETLRKELAVFYAVVTETVDIDGNDITYVDVYDSNEFNVV
jgi:hypothetical protein